MSRNNEIVVMDNETDSSKNVFTGKFIVSIPWFLTFWVKGNDAEFYN